MIDVWRSVRQDTKQGSIHAAYERAQHSTARHDLTLLCVPKGPGLMRLPKETEDLVLRIKAGNSSTNGSPFDLIVARSPLRSTFTPAGIAGLFGVACRKRGLGPNGRCWPSPRRSIGAAAREG